MARAPWRDNVQEIIFEADTPSGKLFDVLLLVAIVASVAVIMLESVRAVERDFGVALRGAELAFTIAFTLEYILRLVSVEKPLEYAKSFFGIVDLLSIIPTYVSFIIPGVETLLVLRAFRLLRIFRVLKLVHFLKEASQLANSVKSSLGKITVFLGVVVTLVIIVGALMYLIEGEANGFTSIPRGVYWAVVTMTTVGYGDIAPQTILGQAVATVLMISGYAIIAVPTGIISVEMAQGPKEQPIICSKCGTKDHGKDAKYCRGCGSQLS